MQQMSETLKTIRFVDGTEYIRRDEAESALATEREQIARYHRALAAEKQRADAAEAQAAELRKALQALWDIGKDLPSVTKRADLVTQVRRALASPARENE